MSPNSKVEISVTDKRFSTVDDFKAWMADFESRNNYKRPQAFGLGLATTGHSDKMPYLDTYFQAPNYKGNFGTAAVLAYVSGYRNGNEHRVLSIDDMEQALKMLDVFTSDGKKHPNIEALKQALKVTDRQHMVVFLEDVDAVAPADVPDAYLRLHLLSHRLAKPNSINVDKIFAVLPNVVWTSQGPMMHWDANDKLQVRERGFFVRSVDKFPSMLDYVTPDPSVRIADGARVRLGAYLGNGTTVMHEGFCNFNAGCEGPNMIEGRISQGVWVGAHTDIGGGASLMGTLSGGGTQKVFTGNHCLVGANAGIGIALGNNCVVEAGLYVTAGKKVWYRGERVKAVTLSGKNNLRFISDDGKIVVTDGGNKAELNLDLHATA